MSVNISTVFQTLFDAEVKKQYQGIGKLRDTVYTKSGVIGDTVKFRKVLAGIAQPHIPSADIVPIGVDYTQPSATLLTFDAGDYISIADATKFNFDERKEIATTIAMALGRKLDQIILDAAVAGASSTSVATSVGGTDSGLNVEKVRRVGRLMDANGVPNDGERYLVISAIGKENLLADAETTSTDYTNYMAYERGDLPNFYGFKIKVIDDRTEGGLPTATGDVRTNLAWHKRAIGLGIGMDITTRIDYSTDKASYLALAMLTAGATVIDSKGVYKVLGDET
jgi:hypothetical protein